MVSKLDLSLFTPLIQEPSIYCFMLQTVTYHMWVIGLSPVITALSQETKMARSGLRTPGWLTMILSKQTRVFGNFHVLKFEQRSTKIFF